MGKHQSKLIRGQYDDVSASDDSISSCSACSSTVSVSSCSTVDNEYSIDSIISSPLSESEKSRFASLPDLKFETSRKKHSKKCNHKTSRNAYSSYHDPSHSPVSNSTQQTQRIQNQVSPILPSTDFNIYNYINHRKYSKNNFGHLYPIDDRECDRLQYQFYIYKHVWENNFSAPVHEILCQENAKVLDVGCGPGYWTLETSVDYPLAHFVGIDAVKTFPTIVKPQNVEFIQANVLKGLPFTDNTFDFVMIRLMIFAFTLEEWEKAISEAVRVCKVGGWVEIMEKDILFFGAGKIANEAQKWVSNELRKKKKIEVVISPHLPRFLSITTKITNIHHAERNVPFGEYAGSLGKNYSEIYAWGAKNLKKVIKDIGGYRGDIGGNKEVDRIFGESGGPSSSGGSKKSTRRLGFTGSDKEWDEVVDRCVEELNARRAYDKIHRVWGVKIDESAGASSSTISRSVKDGETVSTINGISVIEVL
ncbi:9647_t:CDS:2 [Acaulospora colombiana]|uniref:9647_t:CDS:1 n=1 Tax=Acaulospora colombiana TaxID=27376 RepID=A0ACA9KDA6_9GLOM|nr:9647_t:CDS:2 [Acaulospora colombiana]